MKKFLRNKVNIICLLNIVYFGMLLFSLCSIKILSIQKIGIISGFILIITLAGIIMINLRKKIIKILGITLLIVSIILCAIASYYTFMTIRFLNESFNSVKKTVSTYYIVTSKDNKYSKKSNIKDKVYYYKDSANIKNVLKVVKEDLKVKTSSYDNVTSMIKDVINKKIDFMLIDKSSYNIVLNLDGNMNKKDLKIVYKFDIEQKIKSEKEAKTAFNIYIRGIDTDGLSDYNAIATVNTNTHEILLTSIPRDYYMEIAGQNGKKDSLSHMFIYADGTSQKSLENFFDITLDYNIDVQPETLVDLVDKIGGITFCADQDFKGYIIPVNDTDKTESGRLYFKKGCHELNGMETYAVAHERNSFVGRDRMRQKNCQKIIIAIFEKLKSTNLFANYQEILDSLGNLYTTDIPKEVITDIAKDTIDGAEWKFITQSVDGSDKWDADIAILNDKGYAMIPNTKDVINATNKINEILAKKKND